MDNKKNSNTEEKTFQTTMSEDFLEVIGKEQV
jgi:hypothetical protein